jgi:hypothetical protein
MKRADVRRWCLVAFAALSLFMGVTSTGWMLAVVNQWLLPWSTFSIFLPDPAYLERR